MSVSIRACALLAALASAAVLVPACGDDGGSGDSDSSPTPFIAPEALTTEDALALLAEIEAMAGQPSRALIALAQVSEAAVQERSLLILNGIDDVSGLDDVRLSLETGYRVGAGEYLFNVVSMDTAPLSEADAGQINEAVLDEVDLNRTFDPDHGDGMTVSNIYKEAVVEMIRLWYGLIGVPPAEGAPASP